MASVKVIKKICMLGDPAVGKTSLIRKFVFDMFDDKYLVTLGAKVTKNVIEIQKSGKDYEVKLMIWDIAGQKTFGSIKSAYYRGTEGVLLVCDITRKETLINLEGWISTLFKVTKEIPVVFLANKFDLKDNAQFGTDEMEYISSQYKAPYFFTSARSGVHVENAFDELGKKMIKNL